MSGLFQVFQKLDGSLTRIVDTCQAFSSEEKRVQKLEQRLRFFKVKIGEKPPKTGQNLRKKRPFFAREILPLLCLFLYIKIVLTIYTNQNRRAQKWAILGPFLANLAPNSRTQAPIFWRQKSVHSTVVLANYGPWRPTANLRFRQY